MTGAELRFPRLAAAAAVLALLACQVGLPAGAGAAPPKLSLTSVEAQFMCTSCHEPLPEVSSPQAQSEKRFVAGLIKRGLTVNQIKRVMVSNYGPTVLAKPPASGFNLTVYILPPAVLILGALGLLYTLPKWRERARRARAEHPEGAPPLDQADAQRLNDDLARFI